MIKYTFRVVYLDINTNLICRCDVYAFVSNVVDDAFHKCVNYAINTSKHNEEVNAIELIKYEVI